MTDLNTMIGELLIDGLTDITDKSPIFNCDDLSIDPDWESKYLLEGE